MTRARARGVAIRDRALASPRARDASIALMAFARARIRGIRARAGVAIVPSRPCVRLDGA